MDKEIKIFVIAVLILFIPYYIWYSINAGSGPIVIVLTTVIVALGLLTYAIKKIWPKSRLAKLLMEYLCFSERSSHQFFHGDKRFIPKNEMT